MEVSNIQGHGQATATAPATVSPEIVAENRQLIQAVKAVNQAELFGNNSELRFSLDKATQRPVAKLIDRETKEVIQQIPPEYVLRMAAELDRLYG